MKTTSCIEALESRDLFSASLHAAAPTPEPAARDGQIVYVGHVIGGGALGTHIPSAGALTTLPDTAEAKEQFTRYKPHITLIPRDR